jgi:O-antigen ligase
MPRVTLEKTHVWLVVLFLFLLPVQTRLIFAQGSVGGEPWEYGTLALFATEVLLWAILMLHTRIIVHTCRRYRSWKWFVGGLLVFSFGSIAWALEPRVALFASLHLMSAVALVLILIALPKQYVRIAAAAFTCGVSVQAMAALVQVAIGWVHPSTVLGIAQQNPATPGVSVVEHAGTRLLRAYGGLPHPNILGGYLAAGVLVVAGFLVSVRKKWQWLFLLAVVALILVALFFTFSRSAWLGLLVGMTVLLSVFQKEIARRSRPPREVWRVWSVVLVFCVVAFGFGVMYRDVVGARLTGGTRLETISTVERTAGVGEAFTQISKRPLQGWGIGNYSAALMSARPGEQAWAYQPVHNTPLLIAGELGIVGIGLVLVLFGVLLQGIRRVWRIGDLEQRVTRAAYAGALVSFVVISLFDHYPWSLYAGLMLGATLVGFLLNQAKTKP